MYAVSPKVVDKLRLKHRVEVHEVEECWLNREGPSLEDLRPQHKTVPTTRWFIAETDRGRRLLVAYIPPVPPQSRATLKTAYEPNAMEERIYAERTQHPSYR